MHSKVIIIITILLLGEILVNGIYNEDISIYYILYAIMLWTFLIDNLKEGYKIEFYKKDN